ncbi:hypothetical protein C8F04DRAFT_1182414 [Mycena alexandri]|uniref:Uncharacterized protein n=1 Tax=Mycena alexandri TaxID=1745969 RepID=A0AAD6T0M7_9AGAR|nr:hypothetical protein C8F04DRAFT_1182414 [Mycena alexandri]
MDRDELQALWDIQDWDGGVDGNEDQEIRLEDVLDGSTRVDISHDGGELREAIRQEIEEEAHRAKEPSPDTDGDYPIRVVDLLDTYTLNARLDSGGLGVAAAFLKQGLFPCAPYDPTVVITTQTLEFFRHAHARCPRLSIQAFVKSLCDVHGPVQAISLPTIYNLLRRLPRSTSMVGRGGHVEANSRRGHLSFMNPRSPALRDTSPDAEEGGKTAGAPGNHAHRTEITAMTRSYYHSSAGLCRETSSAHRALFVPAHHSSCPLYKCTPIPAVILSKWRAMPAQAQYSLHEPHPLKRAGRSRRRTGSRRSRRTHCHLDHSGTRTRGAPRAHMSSPADDASGLCPEAAGRASADATWRTLLRTRRTRNAERRAARPHPPESTKTRTGPDQQPPPPHRTLWTTHTHTPDTPAHRRLRPKEGIIEFKEIRREIYQEFVSDEAAPPSANKGEAEERSARAEPARVQRVKMRKHQPCLQKAGGGGGGASVGATSWMNAPRIRPHPHVAGERNSVPPCRARIGTRAGCPSHPPPNALPVASQERQACHAVRDDKAARSKTQYVPAAAAASALERPPPRSHNSHRLGKARGYTTKKKDKKRTLAFLVVPSASVRVLRGYAESARKAQKGKAPEGRGKERTLWDGDGEAVGASERLAVARTDSLHIEKEEKREDEGEQEEPGNGNKGKMEEGEEERVEERQRWQEDRKKG